MTIKGLSKYKNQVKKILNQMDGINKWQYDFMLELFGLYLSVKGRINFLQFGRYSEHGEQRFRNQYEHSFDFMTFNAKSVKEYAGESLIIGFDPSYISKSGKHTHGVGYFWSGCAGKTKWGLEIAGIAAIDIDNHTGFHLEAVQTPSDLKTESLVDHYTKVLITRKDSLLSLSRYIVADAYFSKRKFVTDLCKNGFEVISRLRDDADLQYKFYGEQKGGKGRPRQYDGKIDFAELKPNYFNCIEQNDKTKIFSAIVYSKSLKREINLVIVFTKGKSTKWTHKLYFSTDFDMKAESILEYYQARFQIEFLYRDAKQHTGLNDCQARSKDKLNFHFNASLTTINLAKINHWLNIPKDVRPAFSMADVKTMYHNELLLYRFFQVFAIRPNLKKNNRKITELITYGVIAA